MVTSKYDDIRCAFVTDTPRHCQALLNLFDCFDCKFAVILHQLVNISIY